MAKLKAADAEALIERALAAGIITKGGGGWLSFGDIKLGQGVPKGAAHLVDRDALAVSVEEAISTAAQGGAGSEGGGSDTVSVNPPPLREAIEAGLEFGQLPSTGKKNDATHIVVKSKAERGRWRAGRKFTREETVIALSDLSGPQLAAIEGDGDLVVNFLKEE